MYQNYTYKVRNILCSPCSRWYSPGILQFNLAEYFSLWLLRIDLFGNQIQATKSVFWWWSQHSRFVIKSPNITHWIPAYVKYSAAWTGELTESKIQFAWLKCQANCGWRECKRLESAITACARDYSCSNDESHATIVKEGGVYIEIVINKTWSIISMLVAMVGQSFVNPIIG